MAVAVPVRMPAVRVPVFVGMGVAMTMTMTIVTMAALHMGVRLLRVRGVMGVAMLMAVPMFMVMVMQVFKMLASVGRARVFAEHQRLDGDRHRL